MEASSEVELHLGDEHHVVLGSLGSAGYAWEYEVVGILGVILIHQALPKPVSVIQSPALQTYSVEHDFIIEALNRGKAEAKFMLRRPWEKGIPPLKVISVRVTVIS